MGLAPSVKNYLFTNTNFNTHYALSGAQLPYLYNAINRPWNVKDDIGSLFSDINSFIVSLYQYPFSLTTFFNETGDSVHVKVGKKELTDVNGVYINGHRIYPALIKTIGYLDINAEFNNFLDYQVKYSLYLPFVNTIDLEASAIIGKKIEIQCSVDLDTGGITYYINVYKTQSLSSEKYQYMVCKGRCGVEMPLGNTNARENSRNLLMSSISMLGGMALTSATGNPAGVLTAALGGFKQALGTTERLSKGSTQGGIDSLYSAFSILLIVDKPKINSSATRYDYAPIKGRPLQKYGTIGDYSGFTKLSDVHVENIPDATESEKREIESLLLQGIII